MSSEARDPLHRDATIAVFGFEPTVAQVTLQQRSNRWRVGRAARILALAVVVAPVVALVPPHAPWALGALGGGVILARLRWQERTTLVSLEGSCPRCGAAMTLPSPARLRSPHPVECGSCGHQGILKVDLPSS